MLGGGFPRQLRLGLDLPTCATPEGKDAMFCRWYDGVPEPWLVCLGRGGELMLGGFKDGEGCVQSLPAMQQSLKPSLEEGAGSGRRAGHRVETIVAYLLKLSCPVA